MPDTGPTSGQIFGYDRYNNQTDKYEYGYGSTPAIGPDVTPFSVH